MKEFTIYTAKINITPQFPLRLAGFANRKSNFERIEDEIYAQLLLLEDSNGTKVLFVSADILWWGNTITEYCKKLLEKILQLQPNAIILSATHNHSGPGLDSDFLPDLEQVNEEYRDFFVKSIEKAAHSLYNTKQTAYLHFFQTAMELQVYRRRMEGEQIRMAPNFDVEIDHNISIFSFQTKDEEVLANIIHYPCHTNVSASNTLHGDYVGAAMRTLDTYFPTSSVNLFWQGATGDIRPLVIENNEFVKLGYEEARLFGKKVAKAVYTCLQNSKGIPIDGKITVKSKEIPLKLKPYKTIKQLEEELQLAEIKEQRKEQIYLLLSKKTYDTRLLQMTKVLLGGKIHLLFLNAEPVGEYARYPSMLAKEKNETCITSGYTNGMVGYLSTKAQLEEGGYEPIESTYWFALPGPFHENTEEKIKRAMDQLFTE